MNLKNKFGILVSACTVIGVAAFGYTHLNSNNLEAKESYSTEAVLDTLWDNYEEEVQSTQTPGGNFQAIDVSVYEEEDIDKVENYLVDNLSEEDLKDFKLNVYQWSSDVGEFRDNAQENLDSNDLNSDD